MNHITTKLTSLLLGAVAVIGCQSEPVEVNPNFDPEKDEVNAAFLLSVATGSSSTKMQADAVQQDDNFLGIEDCKIFLYADGTQPNAFVKSSDGAKFKEMYDLGKILAAGEIDGGDGNKTKSNRVVQLTIPLGSDAALFYGKAVNNSPGKKHGKMDFSHISSDPAETYFGVSRRIGDEAKVQSYDATARLMIFAINTIMHTSIDGIASYKCPNSPTSEPAYTNLPAIDWPTIGHRWEGKNPTKNPYNRPTYTDEMVPLEVTMGQAYATFTHINTNEYRAGSSVAVKAMMKDLYAVLSHTAGAVPTSPEEANMVRLADQAITNVNKFFSDNWSYRDKGTIKTNAGISDDDWNNATTGYAAADNLNGYPYLDFGIPEGAAQLAFDPSNDMFSYTNPNKALVTPNKTFDPRKYVYAPELTYYVNSPLWVTSKANLSISDFPNGTTAWNNTSATGKWQGGGWNIGKVESNTRGVAIRDNVNYGVAMLQTMVDFSSDAHSSGLQDNREVMTGEPNQTISVNDAHFTLRGVLIGGVHPRYNWQFIPRALTDAEKDETIAPGSSIKTYGVFDGVIYDDDIPYAGIPTSTTLPNYTLVYDNYNYSGAAQNDVYIALEFENGGDAFWGRDNLIPQGGVFYLGAKLTVAPKKLDDATVTQTIAWPTDHQIPPLYESGENIGKSMEIPRVFIQDFLTKATFLIGENSLQYAYYTVPNLESSQMSFGLSVDLSWENGYEYLLEFGANN